MTKNYGALLLFYITCAQINDTIVLLVDSKDCVGHNMSEVVFNRQVQGSISDWLDHVINLRVVPNHSQDLLVMSHCVIFKGTLNTGQKGGHQN